MGCGSCECKIPIRMSVSNQYRLFNVVLKYEFVTNEFRVALKFVFLTYEYVPCSIWIQKFIETRKTLELIGTERLTKNTSKNASNEILETLNSTPDTFNCSKKQARAILTLFSSTYAYESTFSGMNNTKDSLRNHLADGSNSACILLKVTSYQILI
ncbi:dimer_Tnp_hAT domain-containing protein [Trichonephila clavipes]|nr:dimer_Tnp_hAT domain-containing protein [Trichonephila clavipes]